MTILIQILLAAVIATFTIMLSAIGFQIFHILHDMRITVKKLNRILDNTQTLSESAVRPVTAVNSFFTEVKDLVHETQDEIIAATPDKVITPSKSHLSESRFPRFFKKAGLPLRSS